jgi:Na+/proline symporter
LQLQLQLLVVVVVVVVVAVAVAVAIAFLYPLTTKRVILSGGGAFAAVVEGPAVVFCFLGSRCRKRSDLFE